MAQLKVNKTQYSAWTTCVGAFLYQMGPRAFLEILPLRLVEHDLNSLTFAQDSRSWLLPLLATNVKGRPGADLDYFVASILPMILHLA